MNPLQRAVIQKADALRGYLVATAQELVCTPSINHPPTGEEYACQMIVARHLRLAGLEPELYYLEQVPGLKEHPSYWPGRDYSDRPNVSVRRNSAGGGRSLVLSGHIDTVPLGVQPWKHDPFGGQIEAGKLYGLGAYDMKGGVTLILGVLRLLQELGVELKGDLIAETVVDEEFGGVNGTLAGRVRGDNGEALVITEPTGLTIGSGVQGGLVAQIVLKGQEGILFHAGEPGGAIRQLAHFLKWVDIFRQRRRAMVPGWAPGSLDPVPVWVTKVSAGGWGFNVPNTIPAEVKVELYWQLVPGEEKEQVLGQFYDWIDEMLADQPNDFNGRPEITFPIRFMPASQIPADAPVIRSLAGCAAVVTGQEPAVRPLPAPSDLFVVQRDFAIPAVHFGPGGGGAHAADEYLILDDLVQATKILALFALDWCGVA